MYNKSLWNTEIFSNYSWATWQRSQNILILWIEPILPIRRIQLNNPIFEFTKVSPPTNSRPLSTERK